MKLWCVLVVFVFMTAVPAFTSAGKRPNVRPLGPWAAEVSERGLSRSARVRALVGAWRQSDVIVHVLTSRLPGSIAGRTRFVG